MARNCLRTLHDVPKYLGRQRSLQPWIRRLRVELLEDRRMLSLVAAYSFNEGSGGSVTDFSGTANVRARSNTTWPTSGKFDGALSFNGASKVYTATQESGSLGNFTAVLSETIPPDVALTAPATGTIVSDIVVVAAQATDNDAIGGVQFIIDGVLTGSLDTAEPYGLTWDTRTVGNGAHVLAARAYDTSGNTADSSPVTVNVSNTSYFSNEILATGFNLPTNIEFLPDGRMLVAEIAGTIKVLPPPYTTPDPTPFLQLNLNIPGYAGLQQGIMDVALDPNFATNHYYYVFYTKDVPNRDRLSRFTANSALTGTIASSEVILYEDPQTADTEHHGGAINFGNDGKIYVTTGDHFQGTPAQDLTSPRGKVLRFNPDGTAPTDNPFFDGAGPNYDAVWAYGLRNPFRAYYDAPTGRLFVGDVGGNDYSTAKEEINLGARGANYGWPNVEGTTNNPNYTNPIYNYAHNGRDASVVGGFVYHGNQFPSDYQGSYFFADYTQNWIRRLTFDANGNVNGVFNFEPADGSVDGPYGDIVYLTEGPDGAIYYVDLGYSDISGTFGVSKIRRIQFIQGNLPPVVAASTTPVSSLTFNFSSAGSSDPEGQPLTYLWTFGDGQTSTQANPQHTYASAGVYEARLSVSDGVNSTLSPPISISAGNRPVITNLTTTPANNGLFRAGDVISFSGTATDAEDGTLPASAFSWAIDFLHAGHVHPGGVNTGVTSGTFTIPTSGHDFSGDTRYRITLTVTDSNGLQASQSSTVFPEKVNLSFNTAPGSLTLYLDGIAHTAPFVYDTLIGFNHTIEARNQTILSSTYTFASWSDGGAQTHSIIVPTVNQSYVATFTSQPSGLVAAYAFNEGSGTSVTDFSGTGNVGTTSNTTWSTSGKFGGALSFDGGSSRVNVADANSLDLTTGMTLEAWVNPTAVTSDWRDVIYKGNDNYYLSATSSNSSRPAGGVIAGGGLAEAFGAATLPLNTWTHLATTYDGSAVRLYVNGTLVSTTARTGTITTSSNPLQIGSDSIYGQYFAGLIDEVRVYNVALTQAQIQADMNMAIGSPVVFGDYNRDGAVAAGDYVVWRKMLNGSVAPYNGADGNGNGVIDQGDFSVWKAHFGQTLPAPATGSGASLAPVQSQEPAAPITAAQSRHGEVSISDDTLAASGQLTVEVKSEENLVGRHIDQSQEAAEPHASRGQFIAPRSSLRIPSQQRIRASLGAKPTLGNSRRDDMLVTLLASQFEMKPQLEESVSTSLWRKDDMRQGKDTYTGCIDQVFELLAIDSLAEPSRPYGHYRIVNQHSCLIK